MTSPDRHALRIIPGTVLVFFQVRLVDAQALLALPAARFLEGLRAARDLLRFGPVLRDEERLDELLPWSGNV